MLWREYRDLGDRDARVSLTPLHSGSTLFEQLTPLSIRVVFTSHWRRPLGSLKHKFLPNNVCQGFLP
jgi:hypothetical protein